MVAPARIDRPARAPRARMPVSFFGMAVGTLALGNAWRAAGAQWSWADAIAPVVGWFGLAVYLVVLAAYLDGWRRDPSAARAELRHPIQGAFTALAPTATMLAATTLQPVLPSVALVMAAMGIAGAVGLGVWLFGRLWQGGQDPDHVTPAVYLPAVAQNFVAGTTFGMLGLPEVGLWFFGAGLFSWLAVESMIFGRAATRASLPPALRPVLGIQLAPPVVGGVTYLSVVPGGPTAVGSILLGYGLFQAALLVRLLPWIGRQPFGPGYWAFSFGVAALPTLALRLSDPAAGGVLPWLAAALFALANLVIGGLVVGTVVLLVRGRLLPRPAVSA